MSIIYRSVKGINLTPDEVDGNFSFLDNKFDGFIPTEGSTPIGASGRWSIVNTNGSTYNNQFFASSGDIGFLGGNFDSSIFGEFTALSDGSINIESITAAGTVQLGRDAALDRFQIQGNAIDYAADYSGSYTSRSLIDKGYAVANFAPISGGGYLPLAGGTMSGSILFGTALGIDTSGAGTLNIGNANATIINIGRTGQTVNILGSTLYENVTNLTVTDKLITLNKGGATTSGNGVGFEVEENSVITGYLKVSSSRTGFDLLSPASSGVATLIMPAASHNYTFPAFAGTFILDSGTQNIAGTKTFTVDQKFSDDVSIRSSTTASNFILLKDAGTDLSDGGIIVNSNLGHIGDIFLGTASGAGMNWAASTATLTDGGSNSVTVSSAGISFNTTKQGFYSTSPIAKQNFTADLGGSTGLQSVVQAMAALGLITDSSTLGVFNLSSNKTYVKFATTTNFAALNGNLTDDGIAAVTGDRVLVCNQTTGSQNGIYVANTTGAWTRSTDNSTAAQILGTLVYVISGTVNASKIFTCTNTSAITLGTTAITFATYGSGGSSQWTTTGSDIYYNTGKVMIGSTGSPLSKLHIVETSTSVPRGILADQYSTDAVGSRITMRKGRGTFASPTTIVTADVLGSWTAAGYDGTNFLDAAKILVTSVGTIGTGRTPTKMELQTMTDVSMGVLTTALTLDQAQGAIFAGHLTVEGVTSTGATGTGKFVFDTAPTVGALTVTTINKLTITAPATSATLRIANGASFITSGAFSVTLTATALTNIILPTSGTVATIDQAETFTNKTLTAPVITSPTLTVGSDATGDMYYNGGSGALTRLAAGAAGKFLMFNGTGAAPIVSTLVMPNSLTANNILYGSATNTVSSSASLQFDGTNIGVGVTPSVLAHFKGSAPKIRLDFTGMSNSTVNLYGGSAQVGAATLFQVDRFGSSGGVVYWGISVATNTPAFSFSGVIDSTSALTTQPALIFGGNKRGTSGNPGVLAATDLLFILQSSGTGGIGSTTGGGINAITVYGNGDTNFASTTEATSATVASVMFAGGVGINKKLFVTGNTALAGTLAVTGAATLSSTLGVAGITSITNATTASSITTGALVVTGGISSSDNLWINGTGNFANVVSITSAAIPSALLAGGALLVTGGASFGSQVYFGNALFFQMPSANYGITLSGSPSAGTNALGNDITINPGAPTGNAVGSKFIVQTSTPTTTGTTVQTNATRATIDNTGFSLATISLKFSTVGQGVQYKSGSNGKVGTGTLVGGTATISNTSITANSLVFCFDTNGAALTNVGSLAEDLTARVNGTSFKINSTNVLDTSTFNYQIIETF